MPNFRPRAVTLAPPDNGEFRITNDTTGASKDITGKLVPVTLPTVTTLWPNKLVARD
jgi:hypothetical protein